MKISFLAWAAVSLALVIPAHSDSNIVKDISLCDISVEDQVYTGEQIVPDITVKYDGAVLESGKDYRLACTDNTDAGTAELFLEGTGPFTGSVTVPFNIEPEHLSHAEIRTEDTFYTGEPLSPLLTVEMDGKVLEEGRDYAIVRKDSIEEGTGIIILEGRGNYCGTKRGTFVIEKPEATLPWGTYYIVPCSDKDSALSITGMSDGSAIAVKPRRATELQKFKIECGQDGTYRISSAMCGLALTCDNDTVSLKDTGILWEIFPCADESYRIKYDGNFLNADGHAHLGKEPENFRLVKTKDIDAPFQGIYIIGSASDSSYVLHVEGSSKMENASIFIQKSCGLSADMFRFVYSGNSTYRLVNARSGKVISVSDYGTKICQKEWTGDVSQRWEVIESENGYKLRGIDGKYLTISGSIANGRSVIASEFCDLPNEWVMTVP